MTKNDVSVINDLHLKTNHLSQSMNHLFTSISLTNHTVGLYVLPQSFFQQTLLFFFLITVYYRGMLKINLIKCTGDQITNETLILVFGSERYKKIKSEREIQLLNGKKKNRNPQKENNSIQERTKE